VENGRLDYASLTAQLSRVAKKRKQTNVADAHPLLHTRRPKAAVAGAKSLLISQAAKTKK
jgi:hypothetical protein